MVETLHLSDSQIHIPNYNIFRSDRRSRIRGGAMLYIHDSIPVIRSEKFDDTFCEAVICSSSKKNIIASVYKPPHAPKESFHSMLCFLDDFIQKESSGNPELYQVIITGDFNFPEISWEDLHIANHSSEDRVAEDKVSAKHLLNFMSKLLLSNYVDVPTRQNNTLDLLLTNDPNLVQHVSADSTTMSDHDIINAFSTDFTSRNASINTPDKDNQLNFQKLNFHKANFSKISQSLGSVDWDSMKQSTSLEEFPLLFNKKVFEICQKYTPVWENRKIFSCSQRHRRALNRRKYRLRSRISAIKRWNPTSHKIVTLQKEVDYIQQQIKNSILDKMHTDEQDALHAMKLNSKAYYKYAKNSEKTISQIR